MKDILLSRRQLLGAASGLAGALLLPGVKVSFANMPTEKRFIFYILRGAMDGLSAIPAYGDKNYVTNRNGLALPQSAYTPLDGFFATHRNLAAFADMFKAGDAAAIHAVCTPYRDRSHFDAQNVLESGGVQPNRIHDGWLNRTLALYGTKKDGFALAVGQSVPLALQGAMPVSTWAPSAQGLPDSQMLLAFDKLYQHDMLFHTAFVEAVDIHGIAKTAMGGNTGLPEGSRDYSVDGVKLDPQKFSGGDDIKLVPNKATMGLTMRAVGKIMAAADGPRIATIEQAGWDTHSEQGTDHGMFAIHIDSLNAAFAGLKESLGEQWKNTVILAATEFGRTVAQNGTGGTDHGTASCAFLLGGAVNGGKIYGEWPGLDKTQQLDGRDLRPTTDLRAIGKTVLKDHLGLPLTDINRDIFAGSDDIHPYEGLIRGV
ncbi:MAG: DUF1501 domain-containing protein [Micavibrio sp.]|nr:DUF1501 domain-containing protein [Micavibrio sp.]